MCIPSWGIFTFTYVHTHILTVHTYVHTQCSGYEHTFKCLTTGAGPTRKRAQWIHRRNTEAVSVNLTCSNIMACPQTQEWQNGWIHNVGKVLNGIEGTPTTLESIQHLAAESGRINKKTPLVAIMLRPLLRAKNNVCPTCTCAQHWITGCQHHSGVCT